MDHHLVAKWTESCGRSIQSFYGIPCFFWGKTIRDPPPTTIVFNNLPTLGQLFPGDFCILATITLPGMKGTVNGGGRRSIGQLFRNPSCRRFSPLHGQSVRLYPPSIRHHFTLQAWICDSCRSHNTYQFGCGYYVNTGWSWNRKWRMVGGEMRLRLDRGSLVTGHGRWCRRQNYNGQPLEWGSFIIRHPVGWDCNLQEDPSDSQRVCVCFN